MFFIQRIARFFVLLTLSTTLPAGASVVNYGVYAIPDCTIGCVARYQQVYRADDFGLVPVAISRVSFFSGVSGWSDSSFVMTLSTSKKPVAAGLDTVFANNLGADAAWFGAATFATFSVNDMLSFGGMFVYDPGMGDLLIDIVRTGSGNGPPYLQAGYDARFERAYSFSSLTVATAANQNNYGNKTQFEFELAPNTVPEPASLALLGLGLAGLSLRRRYKG